VEAMTAVSSLQTVDYSSTLKLPSIELEDNYSPRCAYHTVGIGIISSAYGDLGLVAKVARTGRPGQRSTDTTGSRKATPTRVRSHMCSQSCYRNTFCCQPQAKKGTRHAGNVRKQADSRAAGPETFLRAKERKTEIRHWLATGL
jgi:hypothetical protein